MRNSKIKYPFISSVGLHSVGLNQSINSIILNLENRGPFLGIGIFDVFAERSGVTNYKPFQSREALDGAFECFCVQDLEEDLGGLGQRLRCNEGLALFSITVRRALPPQWECLHKGGIYVIICCYMIV